MLGKLKNAGGWVLDRTWDIGLYTGNIVTNVLDSVLDGVDWLGW